MGDLQCAARVFVARHGAAEYESPLLSDAGGWLSPIGRRQSRDLADALAGERIARVWTSDMSRSVQTGEIVAGRLGVDVVVRAGLRELGVIDRFGAVLAEIADAHRGESVLVVSHGGAICLALPVLARNLDPARALERPLPSCAVVALEGDADGWVARTWNGEAV